MNDANAKEIDWSRIFQNGECPDCGETIPNEAGPGSECVNCGHVFWTGDNDVDGTKSSDIDGGYEAIPSVPVVWREKRKP